MAGLNYKRSEKKWSLYHRFEQRQKAGFLKKASAKDGFKVLRQLHSFVYNTGNKPYFSNFDMSKLKMLAFVHEIFNKVG